MAATHSLELLIQALRRLPGVGAKSAARMAFHLLQHDRDGAQALSRALALAVEHDHGGRIAVTLPEPGQTVIRVAN